VRTRITWAVTLAAAGVFASALLLRRPQGEADASRLVGERHPSSSVREDPDERRASFARVSPTEVTPAPGLSAVGPPEGTLANQTAVSVLRPPAEDFWEGLEMRSGVDPERYRREMIVRTAEYLELDPSRVGVFQGVAVQSLTAIQAAWRVRDAEVLSLPASVDAKERDQREQEIQERYETAKRQASDRLESLLGTTARHERFRQKLGEWIDAVR